MGKNDFLTPKQIANRIKAKGLTKLRFYCQMCQKMCRDENGFKCHLTSDSHKRQMEVFGQNPDRVIDGYSEEFQTAFLEHMRVAHPRARIAAHKVYNELIQDKHHVHMNSTKWHTLTEFVKYLGREGYCRVEETSKGWFISLIHRDEEQETAEEARAKRLKKEAQSEMRAQRDIQAQVNRALAAQIDPATPSAHGATPTSPQNDSNHPADAPRAEFKRDPDAAPLQLSLGFTNAKAKESSETKRPASAAFGDDDGLKAGAFSGRAKKSKGEEIMEREMAQRSAAQAAEAAGKDSSGRTDAWLCTGIVVKIMAKALKDAGYYKAKGEVVNVVDKYGAEVEMLDSGDIVRVDQAELETVIPKPGGRVQVVNGKSKGTTGVIDDLIVEDYKARVRMPDGSTFLADYEDVCRIR